MLKSQRLEGGIETFVASAFLSGDGTGEFGHIAYCLRRNEAAADDPSRHAAPLYWGRLPDAVGKLAWTPWALWRARFRDAVSIVHFHGFGASVWAPLAKALGMKVVAHSHGIEWERARWTGLSRRLMYAIARITCRFADRTLVVSRKESEIYGSSFGARCTVIPGGFESHAAAIDPAAPRERTVVLAGRPVPEKRILDAIDAWNAVPDHHGHVLRVFCGGNYGGRYLEAVAASCRAGRDVELSGFVTREAFVAQLCRSSLFLAPSSLEGRSLAMLEALATGNVLLVADTPENREFVPGEVNHFVPAQADVPALARALETALGAVPSPAARERNTRAGRQRSWADVRRDCEAVYATL
jgi:glycosyltransferase involved in cell wall biosynthesis